MDELSEFRRNHIGRAVARAFWTFQDRFAEKIVDRGYDDFRPSDVEIIARLPAEGARVTDLAARARSTKQAVAQLVRGLEERGYVKRQPDPDDGRAQRVLLTRRGKAFFAAARGVIEEIEYEWIEEIGETQLKRVRKALLALADAFGPPDYL